MAPGDNIDEILTWIYMIGYGEYVDILRPHFEDDEVTNIEVLKCLDIDDLKKYGINNILDRKKIVEKIKAQFGPNTSRK